MARPSCRGRSRQGGSRLRTALCRRGHDSTEGLQVLHDGTRVNRRLRQAYHRRMTPRRPWRYRFMTEAWTPSISCRQSAAARLTRAQARAASGRQRDTGIDLPDRPVVSTKGLKPPAFRATCARPPEGRRSGTMDNLAGFGAGGLLWLGSFGVGSALSVVGAGLSACHDGVTAIRQDPTGTWRSGRGFPAVRMSGPGSDGFRDIRS